MDRDGNTYFGAVFPDTLHVGTVEVVSRGMLDAVIVKVDRSGSVVWWRSIGGTGDDHIRGLRLGPDGSLYAATSLQGDSVVFAGVPVEKEESSSSDMVVARLGNDGAVRWVRRFGGPGWDMANSVAPMPDGGCVIAGSFMDSMRVGSTMLRMVGTNDGCVIRLNADGEPLWARRFGGDDYELPWSIAVDADGSSYTTGQFVSKTLYLDTFALTNVGTTGGFIVSFDADGDTRFARTAGVGEFNSPTSIAVDPIGALYITATYYGTVDFGEIVLPGRPYQCGYVASYSRDGAFRWVRDVCGDSSTVLNGIAAESSLALDGGESVFVTGGLAGRMTAGATELVSRPGGCDLQVLHLVDGGEIDWGVIGGGPIDDIGYAVATDGLGTCAVTGIFSLSSSARMTTDATFGPFTLASRGAGDVVIAWIGSAAGVERGGDAVARGPARFAVEPNPARGRAAATVRLDRPASVRIELADVLGSVVYTRDERVAEAGSRRIPIETSGLVPGLYICRLTVDGVPTEALPLVVR